ncbi:hypothetical protein KIN_37400 [Litoreibacter roseus]|uniref:Uncharacterized protein n=1 Tax=Litoreibacter roseus TaxID=2601869 RepID=A0A6N6JK31_9RHOB|nr:hypothetical protein KIN_37400 [Litoreibacter roseus]
MIAHMGKSAPKLVIGIIFMLIGRPMRSTPDICAMENMTHHAASMAPKKPSHPMDLIAPLNLDSLRFVLHFNCQTLIV